VKLPERTSDFWFITGSLKVKIETVLPRLAHDGTTLDFEQVNRAIRKWLQSAV